MYLVSHEEQRVEAELKAIAKAIQYRLFAWSTTLGLVDTDEGQVRQANDPMEAIDELPENSLVLLRDFHLYLQDENPVLLRAVKDQLNRCKTLGKVLIILGCRKVLPPEIEREVVLLDFSLPDKVQLGGVLDGICKSAGLDKPEGDERDRLLDAATGMTCIEAENAFALSVVEFQRIEPAVVAREKAQTVKKNGLLEIVEVRETLDDIGGLDALKTWLLQRRDAFGERARQYRLPKAKGVLLLGVPGTGKSLTAKVAANDVSQLPPELLRKGRWDEVFWTDLPGNAERHAIWCIKIAQLWRNPDDYDLEALATASDGYTGAEIEGIVADSLYRAFADNREPSTLDIVVGNFPEAHWTSLARNCRRSDLYNMLQSNM